MKSLVYAWIRLFFHLINLHLQLHSLVALLALWLGPHHRSCLSECALGLLPPRVHCSNRDAPGLGKMLLPSTCLFPELDQVLKIHLFSKCCSHYASIIGRKNYSLSIYNAQLMSMGVQSQGYYPAYPQSEQKQSIQSALLFPVSG